MSHSVVYAVIFLVLEKHLNFLTAGLRNEEDNKMNTLKVG